MVRVDTARVPDSDAREDPSPRVRVVVSGTYEKSAAYPNVIGRIELIEGDARLDVVERGFPIDVRLDYGSRLRVLWSAGRAVSRLLLNSVGACMALWRERSCDVAYLPYPAVSVLYLLSWMPARTRPRRIVADAFISLYDTVVDDRGLLRSDSLFAHLLRHVESRAFRVAAAVIVDTSFNARHYASTLGVEFERFVTIPLSLHRAAGDRQLSRHPRGDRLRVLFVGTMIPLHGIDTLCAAIESLPRSCAVDIRLIGDGQESRLVEQLVGRLENRSDEGPRLEWVREWQSMPSILEEVQAADLCVGILGTSAKAQRVWPYKNYLYMAQGKAFVTARTPVATELEQRYGKRCFFDVSPGSSRELASLIARLAGERSSIDRMATEARLCYDEELSGEKLRAMLFRTLSGRNSE